MWSPDHWGGGGGGGGGGGMIPTEINEYQSMRPWIRGNISCVSMEAVAYRLVIYA